MTSTRTVPAKHRTVTRNQRSDSDSPEERTLICPVCPVHCLIPIAQTRPHCSHCLNPNLLATLSSSTTVNIHPPCRHHAHINCIESTTLFTSACSAHSSQTPAPPGSFYPVDNENHNNHDENEGWEDKEENEDMYQQQGSAGGGPPPDGGPSNDGNDDNPPNCDEGPPSDNEEPQHHCQHCIDVEDRLADTLHQVTNTLDPHDDPPPVPECTNKA
ncbi:hypothetical protein NP233_g10283 [Leucocoprinus birnbaumii]|uniref:Uncharacterized protein n=1 Tax=Leucocoprinus birnbaumii TaxID=56174 RepID=A0AAD5YMA9_9AGAR|nr:hypothetical protein NP233_g10283 [Leucocoprinus birnbaumii]